MLLLSSPHAWGLKAHNVEILVQAVTSSPHAWGLKVRALWRFTCGFDSSPQAWGLKVVRVPTPLSVDALPHTRGVTGSDAAQGGRIRPYDVGCQDYGLGCSSPHAWGYGQRCCPGRKNPPLRRGVPGLWTGLLFPTRVGLRAAMLPRAEESAPTTWGARIMDWVVRASHVWVCLHAVPVNDTATIPYSMYSPHPHNRPMASPGRFHDRGHGMTFGGVWALYPFH
jgi:hypothetical protein